MRKTFFLLMMLCLTFSAFAQHKVGFIVKEATVIKYDSVYITGTFCSWDFTAKFQIIKKDNVNAIQQKVRDKMFQSFFTTKPTWKGTGLSLSISYNIIK